MPKKRPQFYQDIKARALALGATHGQLSQIGEWEEAVEALAKRPMLIKGDDPSIRDISLRCALETWLSALSVGYQPDVFWDSACLKAPTHFREPSV